MKSRSLKRVSVGVQECPFSLHMREIFYPSMYSSLFSGGDQDWMDSHTPIHLSGNTHRLQTQRLVLGLHPHPAAGGAGLAFSQCRVP